MVVAAGIAAIAALAWAYLVYLALSTEEMGAGMAMARMRSWTAVDFALMFLMWSVMMVGMMTPTAAPMILMFATINRQRRDSRAPYVPTGLFLSSYLLVWTAFAAGATIANWGLHANGLAHFHDGYERKQVRRGQSIGGGGTLPDESLEVGLSQPLPVAGLLHSERLERGTLGRICHGAAARGLLPRLLLGVDGAAVRPWSNEPALDSSPGRVCTAGESRARRTGNQLGKRTTAPGLGRVDGRRCVGIEAKLMIA